MDTRAVGADRACPCPVPCVDPVPCIHPTLCLIPGADQLRNLLAREERLLPYGKLGMLADILHKREQMTNQTMDCLNLKEISIIMNVNVQPVSYDRHEHANIEFHIMNRGGKNFSSEITQTIRRPGWN